MTTKTEVENLKQKLEDAIISFDRETQRANLAQENLEKAVASHNIETTRLKSDLRRAESELSTKTEKLSRLEFGYNELFGKLQRALGYIDRVNESVPNPIRIERAGDFSRTESLYNHGPNLMRVQDDVK